MRGDLTSGLMGGPRRPRKAFPAPLVATVTNTTGGVMVTRGEPTDLGYNPTYVIGPCRGQLCATVAVGDAVLIVMVEGSVANPWIVAVDE